MIDAVVRKRLREFADGSAPWLIATDLDGTLAPIALHPGDVQLGAATLETLRELSELAHVAIVTGRDLAAARALVPVNGVEFVASHGSEASFSAAALPAFAPVLLEPLETFARKVETQFLGEALHVERKACSLAFHYRANPVLAQRLRVALQELPEGFCLQPGRRVLEVLPVGGGKDTAVAALVERFRPGSVLALGDDLTDKAMFQAVHALQIEGISVLALAVAGGQETPLEVVEAGDLLVTQPEVTELLSFLAAALVDPFLA
tara:strand:+ start:18247 stop:19035 length:789 start_codon:yes stop_codon:yes gene_type:complete